MRHIAHVVAEGVALVRDDRGQINNLWDAFFFSTVQLLTVSSQMPNPVTTGGRIVDIALELTALRVVANSADGKPHPASSVLKLKGTELQQAVSELVVDLAGPASLASGAGDDSDLPSWARHAAPVYLNLRKASIYGGSNEVQRQIIAKTILGL